jgi:23S rRNA (cytosine1962-C5)-methyltransferase
MLKLHPLTVKSIKQGHPWITRDSFSSRFPKSELLLKIQDPKDRRTLGHYLHDPAHPKVVARFWSHEKSDFESQLKSKLKEAITKRQPLFKERENIYLAFAEADELPGLYIQKLGETCLIQYHCFVWEKWLPQIKKYLESKKELSSIKYYFEQKRIHGEAKKAPNAMTADAPMESVVSEGQIKFKIRYNLNHDIGLYTDMSAVRKKLLPLFDEAKSVLKSLCLYWCFFTSCS